MCWYFIEVVDKGGLLVIFYNVFGCIGCDMFFEMVVVLCDYLCIVGIKEVCVDGECIWVMVEFVWVDFVYFFGDDGMVW